MEVIPPKRDGIEPPARSEASPGIALVYLVFLVFLVSLVCLVCLVYFVKIVGNVEFVKKGKIKFKVCIV
jgi:hypothetical protein